jgi:hypothetical protein
MAVEVRWGATQVFSRSLSAAETGVSGETNVGVQSAGAYWNSHWFGPQTVFGNSMGSAGDSIAGTIAIVFRAQTISGTAESMSLRNFAVIRYPAQSNP